MAKHTMQDLKLYQALPLDVKIQMTKNRIRGWVEEFGEDGVYVSFSGGKDSTVLLDIVREEYPNIPAVFVDVPTQYPELREFAKTWDNVEIIKPKMSFMQVCDKYGFPLISKEVSHKFSDLNSAKRNGNESYVMRQIEGRYTSKNGKTNMVDISKYKFMLESKFNISHKCCDEMKKKPIHEYEKKTGRKPFTAVMACESLLRAKNWIDKGCNAFESKRPISQPMSFWTEQDVLQYIKENNLPICSVYGDIVEDWSATNDLDGQMTISDLEGWEDAKEYDAKRPPLKTTGCDRSGCVLCGFGCYLEKPGEGRFERLKETHPGFYKLLDVVQNNGVTYREAIEWINEHGDMNIRL